jgi:hypothetical protein
MNLRRVERFILIELGCTGTGAKRRRNEPLLKRSAGGRRGVNITPTMDIDLAGIRIPDSRLAHEITEIVRDTESELLFSHSSRAYLFGALAGEHRGLNFDPELLYAGAMFHDMGRPKRTAALTNASRWTAPSQTFPMTISSRRSTI